MRKSGLDAKRPRSARIRGLIGAAVAVVSLVAAPAALASGVTGALSSSTTLSGADAVAAYGGYAYTTAYYGGTLTAIDYSNPKSPVIAGSSAFSNALLNASTVNVAGGFAFVVSKNRNGTNGTGSNDDGTGNSLTIFDISTNPAVPRIVGTVTDPTKLFGAYGVAVSGNYAYVAAQGCLSGQPCPNSSVGNSFVVIDISSPGSPKIVATLSNSSLPSPWKGTNALDHVCSLAISGSYAYLTAAYSDRLTVINISNPLSPTIVGSDLDTTNLKFPVDVAVKGSYAYVADQSAGLGELAVVDVSNPASPHVVGSVINKNALNGAYRVRLRGNFAYVSAVYAAAVSAVDISNPPSPRVAATVTDTAHLNRTTGLDVDPSSRYVIADSPYLSTQSQPTYPPYPPAAGAPTLTGTVSVITLDPVPIGVSITSKPANPTTQTSATFGFSTTDPISSVLCSIDGAPFSLCTTATSQQYAALSPGSHTFTVQATDAAGNTATASDTWTIQQGGAPVNTAPPAISGTTQQGDQLTASTGTWTGTPAPTFTYAWSDCDQSGASCTPIAGANASTYTAQSSDIGSTLEVTVTATNSSGTASATSQPTAVVSAPPAPPVNTGQPAISGTSQQGDPLTASAGTWTGTPAPTFTYAWSDCDQSGANCTPITGANASTYTPQSSDVGSTLEVTVTATNSAGTASATSKPTAVVTASSSSAPANSVPPAISGSAVEAQTLTASTGTWTGTPTPTFAYAWSECDPNGANCTAIAGANASTYTPVSADVGSTLEVTVTATNSAGTAMATSSPTAVVTSAPGPVTALLDNFNAANNTGPPDASWSPVPILNSLNLEIVSSQVQGTSGGSSGDYWNPQTYGPNSEEWVTVARQPATTSDQLTLGLRFANPGLSTASGYQVYYSYPGTYKIVLRVNGTISSTLASTTSGPTLTTGNEVLFRAIGGTLELWRESGTTWTRVLSATNSTLTGPGYLLLGVHNTVFRLDNFGGGTLP